MGGAVEFVGSLGAGDSFVVNDVQHVAVIAFVAFADDGLRARAALSV